MRTSKTIAKKATKRSPAVAAKPTKAGVKKTTRPAAAATNAPKSSEVTTKPHTTAAPSQAAAAEMALTHHASARARMLVLDEPDSKRAVAALQKFGVTELQRLFHDLFDGETRSTSLIFLRKALAKGLLERAGGAAAPSEPAAEEEKGSGARRPVTARGERDPRLPAVGSTLERTYKGETLHVKVLEEGFSFKGTTYPSLSALAKTLTKCSTNGFLWFGLTERPVKVVGAEASV